tara:strand:+ start:563 stop:742 length:180 start_codon:yes stop_codon:yes gene_type:complete
MDAVRKALLSHRFVYLASGDGRGFGGGEGGGDGEGTPSTFDDAMNAEFLNKEAIANMNK